MVYGWGLDAMYGTKLLDISYYFFLGLVSAVSRGNKEQNPQL